ncbi:hypothetical protein T484DRAFT_1784429 [Baffinella frigidus]|nr:hypothetical protein T484DRAFT_1784429 [Cryptophyta sp. CCMP2293]
MQLERLRAAPVFLPGCPRPVLCRMQLPRTCQAPRCAAQRVKALEAPRDPTHSMKTRAAVGAGASADASPDRRANDWGMSRLLPWIVPLLCILVGLACLVFPPTPSILPQPKPITPPPPQADFMVVPTPHPGSQITGSALAALQVKLEELAMALAKKPAENAAPHEELGGAGEHKLEGRRKFPFSCRRVLLPATSFMYVPI